MRSAFAAVALAAGLVACDSGPVLIDSTAALAAPGTAIPEFSYPSIRGWTFDRSRLLYGHTVMALVPAEVTGTEPALVEFDSLQNLYPMFRFAVVYNRGVEPRDTAYLNPPSWLSGVERGFASDSQIIATFAPGVRDPTEEKRRHALRLPSFLVVSDSGKVLARVAGLPLAALRPVLDSLRSVRDSVRQVEGDAEIARVTPQLERGLGSFDPLTLVDSGNRVRLNGTCSGEETVERGIIPAVARLIDIRARHPGVVTTLEITSIADVDPVGDNAVCNGTVRVIPRIETRRYRVDFFKDVADASGAADVYTDFSIEPLDADPDRVSRALIPLGDSEYRKFDLPDGVTLQDLRARIDSIREAAP